MRVAAALALTLALTACTSTPGGETVRIPVEGRAQGRSLSCESRSAADLLGFHGIRVGEAAVLRALPRSDNPDLGFVGDVDGPGEQLPPAGYGVHAAPVAAVLRGFGLDAVAHHQRDLAWLRTEISAGRPVIVWATGQLDAPAPVAMRDRTGRTFNAVRGEHTFLAVGTAPGTVLLLDPATGKEKRVPESTFDASWATLGRQAVATVP